MIFIILTLLLLVILNNKENFTKQNIKPAQKKPINKITNKIILSQKNNKKIVNENVKENTKENIKEESNNKHYTKRRHNYYNDRYYNDRYRYNYYNDYYNDMPIIEKEIIQVPYVIQQQTPFIQHPQMNIFMISIPIIVLLFIILIYKN